MIAKLYKGHKDLSKQVLYAEADPNEGQDNFTKPSGYKTFILANFWSI